MTNDFIEQKFKELIYEFGEIDFDMIKKESWEKYINRNEKFNEEQIKTLRNFVKQFLDDLTDDHK